MDIDIRAKPYFVLPLTRVHIDALIVMSVHHYDACCQKASEQGGFLFLWDRLLKFDEEFGSERAFTVDASLDEAQIVLKILESKSICKFAMMIDDTAYRLCVDLSRDLYKAFEITNAKYIEWRTTYHGSKVGTN